MRAMSAARAACMTALCVLGGCNQPRMQNVASYAGPALPPPERVVVSYFAVAPEDVRLDQGVAARVRRTAGDTPLTTLEMQAAQNARVALANELVGKLQGYGLPAVLGAPGTPGRNLLVEGQIVSIDEGNRTRRTLVGLGAGQSSVSADVQLYYQTAEPAPPHLLTTFNGEATSGRMPGAVETMGVGAAADRIATSAVMTGATHAGAEARRTGAGAEAGRLADSIAKRIGQFAATQGWIPAAAVR